MNHLKTLLILAVLLPISVIGQDFQHGIKWHISVKKITTTLYDIQLVVNPTDGWMILSPFQDTSAIELKPLLISIKTNDYFETIGGLKEYPRALKAEKVNNHDSALFIISRTVYTQRVRIKTANSFSQTFNIEYQPIKRDSALPPFGQQYRLKFDSKTNALTIAGGL